MKGIGDYAVVCNISNNKDIKISRVEKACYPKRQK